ncbi:PTS sugar transporter subunit IIB, partial [Escherichia coli]|uniref:PTS sugar transporter subunit IIB n=1 Tax=Escherichia coli TaxID=562 RepID=UPI001CF86B73
TGGTADRNRSHWSTSKTPSYTKSVSWQHHLTAETYGFGIRFFTIEKTINVIGKAAPHQKIFLICRTPQTVRKLVEGGIDLKDVNVGNMHFSEGKKQISSKVYVDDQDLTDLRFIKQRGVNVFIQDVPGDQKEQIPD